MGDISWAYPVKGARIEGRSRNKSEGVVICKATSELPMRKEKSNEWAVECHLFIEMTPVMGEWNWAGDLDTWHD